MAGPTIHQRAHLWLWHWRDGPGWCRNPSSAELRSLYAAGARVIRVQLQDDGDVPVELVQGWKAEGWKVGGAIRPSYDPLGGPMWDALEAADWAAYEKRRLGLQLLDLNFEREVRLADAATGGAWSTTFATRMRQHFPTLAMCLDTVYGDACGGMNQAAYSSRLFRLNVQTYWGNEGIYEDTVPNLVRWSREWGWMKARVKPIFRCSPNNAGQLPNPEEVLGDAARMGTKGLALYYVDGGDLDWMRSFIRRSIELGAAA